MPVILPAGVPLFQRLRIHPAELMKKKREVVRVFKSSVLTKDMIISLNNKKVKNLTLILLNYINF